MSDLRVAPRGPLRASFPPPGHLDVNVTRLGEYRRSAQQLAPRFDHAAIEVVQDLPYRRFGCRSIQSLIEAGVFGAERQRRRAEAPELFALDFATDPPVGVVHLGEPGQRLAGARKVVEVAATHRLLQADLHVLSSRLHAALPGQRGVAIGTISRVAPGLSRGDGVKLVDLVAGDIQPRI